MGLIKKMSAPQQNLRFDTSSLSETKKFLKSSLNKLYLPAEIEQKIDLVYAINRIKKEKNAIVLGHNYMEAALYHGVADFVGDSLGLCQLAASTDNPVIVFLGVEFMAESAKLLNPSKTVLLPSQKAGCSLAASITADDVRQLRQQFPGVPVVTYINTYADVKAETDVCCTSSNASHIVRELGVDKVIFIPDEFLAQNVAKEVGVEVIFPQERNSENTSSAEIPTKSFLSWRGRCEVHEKFTVEDIKQARQQYPDVVVLAHPECPFEVVVASDFSGSTTAMLNYVRQQDKASKYLLLTECAMADNLIAEINHQSEQSGQKAKAEVLRLCSVRCPHMAQITLEQTLECLEKQQYVIEVEEQTRVKAKRSIDRMLELSQNLKS